eukprot:COSAG04_NODE_3218_length_3034_cov_725.639182_1_plen_161_part_00
MESFARLLTEEVKIDKPKKVRQYAQALADNDFVQGTFDALSAEELKGLGFPRGHARLVASYQEQQPASTAPAAKELPSDLEDGSVELFAWLLSESHGGEPICRTGCLSCSPKNFFTPHPLVPAWSRPGPDLVPTWSRPSATTPNGPDCPKNRNFSPVLVQ